MYKLYWFRKTIKLVGIREVKTTVTAAAASTANSSSEMPSAAVGKKENELKAHLDGNKLDLSLMQHEAITPALVRQIAAIPKGITLKRFNHG